MVHKKVQKIGIILSTLSVDKIVYKALNFGSKPNFIGFLINCIKINQKFIQ